MAGEAYRELGRYPEAIDAYQREERVRRRPSWGLGVTFARMGRTDEARQIARALEARLVKTQLEADRIAAIYAALGDLDAAFAWLDRAVELRTGMLTFIRLMPEYDVLRSDARYPVLLRRLGWVR